MTITAVSKAASKQCISGCTGAVAQQRRTNITADTEKTLNLGRVLPLSNKREVKIYMAS
jgi:hypothetical protein